jgi:hypothetical protein
MVDFNDNAYQEQFSEYSTTVVFLPPYSFSKCTLFLLSCKSRFYWIIQKNQMQYDFN